MSWTRIWDWTGYPSKTLRYVLDITEVPWLNFGVTSSSDPQVGAPVYSAMYDVGGFKHDDVTKAPGSMYTNPNFGGKARHRLAQPPEVMLRYRQMAAISYGSRVVQPTFMYQLHLVAPGALLPVFLPGQ